VAGIFSVCRAVCAKMVRGGSLSVYNGLHFLTGYLEVH